MGANVGWENWGRLAPPKLTLPSIPFRGLSEKNRRRLEICGGVFPGSLETGLLVETFQRFGELLDSSRRFRVELNVYL